MPEGAQIRATQKYSPKIRDHLSPFAGGHPYFVQNYLFFSVPLLTMLSKTITGQHLLLVGLWW